MTLVCFAVPQEARPFRRHTPEGVTVLVTGMGRDASERALAAALRVVRPDLVLTCGFAGGLNPELKPLTIVFSADENAGVGRRIEREGGHPATFLCTHNILVTAREKAVAWKQSGADAVEMESGHIRALCAKEKIPSATIRVILDDAEADLPLDFNTVMGPDQRILPSKLVSAIAAKPSLIPKLLWLGKQSKAAAERLDMVLRRVVATES